MLVSFEVSLESSEQLIYLFIYINALLFIFCQSKLCVMGFGPVNFSQHYGNVYYGFTWQRIFSFTDGTNVAPRESES